MHGEDSQPYCNYLLTACYAGITGALEQVSLVRPWPVASENPTIKIYYS